MPFTVITIKNSPPSLKGDLTKWMQEIATGVYVGNFNTKIREELWKRVVDSVGTGEATLSFSFRNEIGYNFETHNTSRIPVDFEGIPLVMIPNQEKHSELVQKHGFSKAAKLIKAKRQKSYIDKKQLKGYVVLDLETTGLDPLRDSIIEIGAIKVSKTVEEYSCLIRFDGNLTETIRNLTGINETDLKNGEDLEKAIIDLLDFIGNEVILGYNIGFDIKFLNVALKKLGYGHIENKTYDVMKFVKQDKMFLKNYKLETVKKEYEIHVEESHRALADAKTVAVLATKLNELMKKLK